MIVLVGFNELESSLFRKASEELLIAKRITYFDSVPELLAAREPTSMEHAPLDYPRVITMNIDAPDCLAELQQLKQTRNWKKIPVIGFGFLEAPDVVTSFYGSGGASCIRKPDTYEQLVETTRTAMGYWLSMSIMPCDYLREA